MNGMTTPTALPRPATDYWTDAVPMPASGSPGPRGRHTVVIELSPTDDAIDIPAGAAGVVIRCASEGTISYRYVPASRFAAVVAAANARVGIK
jgi:hypothetical protein